MVTIIKCCKSGVEWHGGTVLNHFDKKEEVPHVRSVILYKTQFLRDEMLSMFSWALKLKTLQPFSRFIPHSYALRENDFDMRLEVLTKVLVWNCPHVRVKSIVWSAARYEPWDRSRIDDHINFSRRTLLLRNIQCHLLCMNTEEWKRFISFCIRNSQRILQRLRWPTCVRFIHIQVSVLEIDFLFAGKKIVFFIFHNSS